MIDCFMELLLVSSEYTVPKIARITALQLEPVWFLMDQILYTSKQKQSIFRCIRSSHDRLGFLYGGSAYFWDSVLAFLLSPFSLIRDWRTESEMVARVVLFLQNLNRAQTYATNKFHPCSQYPHLIVEVGLL